MTGLLLHHALLSPFFGSDQKSEVTKLKADVPPTE